MGDAGGSSEAQPPSDPTMDITESSSLHPAASLSDAALGGGARQDLPGFSGHGLRSAGHCPREKKEQPTLTVTGGWGLGLCDGIQAGNRRCPGQPLLNTRVLDE